MERHARTHAARKKNPDCDSVAEPATVPWQKRSDDLLLELFIQATQRERTRVGRMIYTSLEAALHRPTVMSCDLPRGP